MVDRFVDKPSLDSFSQALDVLRESIPKPQELSHALGEGVVEIELARQKAVQSAHASYAWLQDVTGPEVKASNLVNQAAIFAPSELVGSYLTEIMVGSLINVKSYLFASVSPIKKSRLPCMK